jgi:WD40 repeat protein
VTEQKTYADFDLLIEGAGENSYHARVVESPAGGAAGTFTLPFSDMELENFLLKVGRPRRGTRRLESPEMEAARQFGKTLYDAVFRDDVKLSLRRSLDEVERRDEGLRIRLWFSDAPELAALPWEFLYDEAEDEFLVLSTWTPIVRYLDLTQRIEPLTVDGPLRILAMISSPHDYPPLDVEQEWRRIEEALQPLTDGGAVVVERTDDATLIALQRHLRKGEYHIFHFLGHGGFDAKTDDGVVVMEDGQGRGRLVAGRDLGTILSDHRSLRLAVLNACEGARASEEDPFSGAAQSVVRKGIPAVVAMQFEITDDAAITFAQEFYGAIADSYPVDAAIGEARRAIFGLGNDIEWGTPVVYMRGDGRLFTVQPAAVAVPPVVEEEPPAPVDTGPIEGEEPPGPVDTGPIETEGGDGDGDGTGRSTAVAPPAVPTWLKAAIGVLAVLIVVMGAAIWLARDGDGTVTTTAGANTSSAAVTTEPGTIEPGTIEPGTIEASGQELGSHAGTVFGVAFGTVDGESILASGSGDATVRLWDPVAAEPRGEPLEGHNAGIDTVAFGIVDGEGMVASGDTEGVIRLWDPRTGDPIGEPLTPDGGPGRQYWVPSLAFGETGDGPVLASGHQDTKIRLWDPRSGDLLEELEGHTARVGGLVFGVLDGSTVLASAGIYDRTVRFWDVESGEEKQELRITDHPGGYVVALDFGEVDGATRLATGGEDGRVRLWDPSTGALVWTSNQAHAGCGSDVCWIEGVAFGEVDGRVVIASGGQDGMVRLWDPATGDQIGEPLDGGQGPLYSLAFDQVADRPTVASGSSDGSIWLWTLSS